MMLPIAFRREAAEDVEAVCTNLNMVRMGLGDRFMERLQERMLLISSHPQAFGVVWDDVRATMLKQFTYVVYYRVQTHRIEVLAIVHGSRDSASWKSRL